MNLSPKQTANKLLGETIITHLKKRQIDGYYAADNNQALNIIREMINENTTVAWGGSMTLDEIGLPEMLKNINCKIYDRFAPVDPQGKREMFGKIATADYYFMSTNAITIDGQLVNIDGNGNRVASLIHGPQNVVVVVGMNKVTTSVEAAMDRVQNIAAPANAIRLGLDTPCAKDGHCHHCFNPQCICSHIVITRRTSTPGRIKVILVDQSLGY